MLRFFLFCISFFIGLFILQSEQLHTAILHLGNFEYIGAFIAGFFVISTFTAVPSLAVLLTLNEAIDPLVLSLIAGTGGACGDYLMMRYFRSEMDELLRVSKLKRHKVLNKIIRAKLFHWIGPLIGALIIASPFPDEIGITLLGISKLEMKKFLFLVFFLDTIGIYLILKFGNILQNLI